MMKPLKTLFPIIIDLDNMLENKFKNFLQNVEVHIKKNKEKPISDIKEEFALSFIKLKLAIEFDKEYTPKCIIEEEPSRYTRNKKQKFENRDYRFKITGDNTMLFVHSGGGIPMGNPPKGYYKDYLYVRVTNPQDLSNKEKIQRIFDEREKQKEVINQCILDQNKKIDEFINKKIQIIEAKFKDIVSKNNEKENFEKSLKNKLSEL